MPEDFYYPKLDVATIKALPVMQQLATDHKAYWLSAPYAGDVQAVLERIFAPKKVIHESTAPDIDPEERADEFLATEARELYQQLKNTGLGLDGSERLAYLKTSTALLEKLLSIQERANNLKSISEFYAIVLDIMETDLTVDQRTRVMTRLEAATKS